ncbi:MAG TPA: helicase-associated domain-containing protein [Spirochaetota bacterium]
MDKLTAALETLSSTDLTQIRSIVGVPPSAGKQALLRALLTYGGIDRLLTSLSSAELALLYQLWKSKTGLTYSELSRELSIDADEIEKIAQILTSKLLVYILKNRKHLNNRLDKIYIREPIEKALLFMSDKDIAHHAMAISESLSAKPGAKGGVEIPKKLLPITDILFDEGGSAHYTTLAGRFEQPELDTLISEGIAKEVLILAHVESHPFVSLVLIHPRAVMALKEKKESGHKGFIDNRFNLLNNLLCTYDMVTSRGLYLTQQHDFRKTDFKRVSDVLIPLYDHRMMTVDAEDSARFSLHILNRLGTLQIKKDAIHIDLSIIERELLDPEKLLAHALKGALKKGIDDPLFVSPFPVPTQEEIHAITEIVKESDGITPLRLKNRFCAVKIEKNPSSIRAREDRKDHPVERYSYALRYALLFGFIYVNEGIYYSAALSGAHEPAAYINPDFSILIPAQEIPKDLLYRVLACTELVKNDVVLQCRISKDSILAAHKRRMHPDRIITELEGHLKNGVPQNMIFMIKEWVAQSLEVMIKDVLLLKVNHPSFIDDILSGAMKDAVIERVSPQHAIVKRDMLDEIVRAATKHNAIISLFTE